MTFRNRGQLISTSLTVVTALLIAGCASVGSGSHSTSHDPAPKPKPKPTTVSHPKATPSASRNLLPVGHNGGSVGVARSFWVGLTDFTITEPAHTNPAGTAIPDRQLLMEVRYPLAGRPSKTKQPAHGAFPLIMFAPGFMQCGLHYDDMLAYWASAGYVVAVVDFPKSDCKTGDAATESDMINQPHDVSYAITKLLAMSRSKHGLFAGLLDPRKIGISGQSDGGDTVAFIAGDTCCSDGRVKAVAVQSGAEWPPVPGKWFSRKPGPILFTQGSADVINPPGCSVQMWRDDRSKARFYLDLFGATHTEPYWGINRYEKITVRVTLAFFDRYVLGEAKQAAVMSKQGNQGQLAALYKAGGGNLALTPCS